MGSKMTRSAYEQMVAALEAGKRHRSEGSERTRGSRSMLLITMYTIVGFGVFLASLFEGEGKFWGFVAGIFWPVVLYRIVRVRYFGD